MDGCEFWIYPLSLKIPALLIRIVTPPNASKADLTTAAPSVTDDVFTTAFPPAIHNKPQCQVSLRSTTVSPPTLPIQRTLDDLVHDFLRSGGVEVIHDNVCSPRSKQQRVTRMGIVSPIFQILTMSIRLSQSSSGTCDDDGVSLERERHFELEICSGGW